MTTTDKTLEEKIKQMEKRFDKFYRNWGIMGVLSKGDLLLLKKFLREEVSEALQQERKENVNPTNAGIIADCHNCAKIIHIWPEDTTRYLEAYYGQKKLPLPLKTRIGMLRQWLNEERIKDVNKFVTNEELALWLLEDK